MNEFDLGKVLAGMSPEDKLEWITSRLDRAEAEKFLEGKQSRKLQEQYQKESDELDKVRLPFNMRLKKLVELKAKYRKLGLRVF